MEITNILAVRNDRLGEFLLTIPALRALKAGYPNARLILLANPYLEELAGDIDAVDGVLVWPQEKHRFSQILELSRRLRDLRFDMSVVFNPSKEINIAVFLAGIPIKAGYSRKWPFLLNRKIPDIKHLGKTHEIESNLQLAALAGGVAQDKNLYLRIDSTALSHIEKTFGIKKGDPCIAIHPFTSDPVKQWPLERFSALAKRLSVDYKVVLIGGREEEEKGRAVFRGPGVNVTDLIGKTGLRQLAALLSCCKVLISGDSGPVHLASCVGTPVVALFRNDMPGKTALRWGPRSGGSVVVEKADIADIAVEEVLQALRETLKKETGQP